MLINHLKDPTVINEFQIIFLSAGELRHGSHRWLLRA